MGSENSIRKYIGDPVNVDGMIRKSPYIAALQDARGVTGRCRSSGTKCENAPHGCWLGAAGYLIVLDHIGSRFYLQGKEDRIAEICNAMDYEKKGMPSFIKALAYFSDFEYREISALYALRCSFLHDYFLFNGQKTYGKERPSLWHHFTVTAAPVGHIVTLPNEAWDGKLDNRSENNKTVINLELLGDFVEGVHKKLIDFTDQCVLEIYPEAKLEDITHKASAPKIST